jgi:hypothetical protein
VAHNPFENDTSDAYNEDMTFRDRVSGHQGQAYIYVELKKKHYMYVVLSSTFLAKTKTQMCLRALLSIIMTGVLQIRSSIGLSALHIDDLKILHIDPNVVSDVVARLEAVFVVEAPLTQTCGKRHDYLGMTLDFSTPRAVIVTMTNYIDSMLSDLPPAMDGEALTPAASHLFDIAIDSAQRQLAINDKEFFHHNVAKLLFLCKCACPDLQTAVVFLCTGVQSPDNDNYKKVDSSHAIFVGYTPPSPYFGG